MSYKNFLEQQQHSLTPSWQNSLNLNLKNQSSVRDNKSLNNNEFLTSNNNILVTRSSTNSTNYNSDTSTNMMYRHQIPNSLMVNHSGATLTQFNMKSQENRGDIAHNNNFISNNNSSRVMNRDQKSGQNSNINTSGNSGCNVLNPPNNAFNTIQNNPSTQENYTVLPNIISSGSTSNLNVSSTMASNVKRPTVSIINNKKPPGKSQVQMENEIIEGLRIQQSWNEKPEVQFICMSVLHLSKLPISAPDSVWQEALKGTRQAIDNYLAKLARYNVSIQARCKDVSDLEIERERIKNKGRKLEQEIEDAKNNLVKAKRMRICREEHDRMSGEILKHRCLPILKKCQEEQLDQISMINESIEKTRRLIDYRCKQAEIVLQSVNAFGKTVTEKNRCLDT